MLKPIKDVQPGFFRWLFMSDRYIQALQSTSNLVRDGQALRFSNFAQVDIPVFPLTEQASIAAFLDRETAKIDALIAEQQRLIELLQEKRQAVISHAVTKGLNPEAPMKDSGVEWLGEVPKHWEIKRIKHTSRMESGHTPDRKVEAYWVNCDIPWVSLNDTGFLKDNDYISETAHCINDLGIQNSSARLLPERVVVFSRDATIGRCAITTKQMAVSQHFIAWICGDEILAEYLLLRLKSMTHELERLTFGATLKTIGMPDVKTLVTPVPPINEQEEIVEHLQGETARLEGMSASVQQAVALLQERRSALISAAVTGQIDVRGLVAEVNAD
jgi:type I restriction enzyme S subunit